MKIGRPKALDPVSHVSVTIPVSLLRTARGDAHMRKISLSAWLTERVTDYFRAVEKALR